MTLHNLLKVSLYLGTGLIVLQSSDATWSVTPMKDLHIHRARPLQYVFYFVETRLHAAIGYEQGSPDLKSMMVSAATVKPGAPSGLMLDKLEDLDVHFVEGEVDPLNAVKTAVGAYDNGSQDHKFTVRRDGDTILVYPEQNSVSSRRISLNHKQRTLDQIALAVAGAVGRVAGRPVRVWTGEFNDPALFDFGAEDEAVSSVLTRFTRLRSGKGSYWLLYSAQNDCYYLSLAFLDPPPVPVSPDQMRALSDTQTLKPVPNNPFFKKSDK